MNRRSFLKSLGALAAAVGLSKAKTEPTFVLSGPANTAVLDEVVDCSGMLHSGGITTGKLACSDITADKIAADAVMAPHLYGGSISTTKIEDRAFRACKIAGGPRCGDPACKRCSRRVDGGTWE